MIILSQRDSKWSAEKLGQSVCTVGRYGCVTVCLSMLSDYFKEQKGSFVNPAKLARGLKFTNDGLIIWSSLPLLLQFSLSKRLYQRNDVEIGISLKDPKKAVILQVENFHWVVALRRLPFGVYLIADPWTGTKRLSTAYKNITGSAHFNLI